MPPKRAALPTKERTLFQRLIQEYETKKYKLGLKTADTILKKFPDHGETVAMKGLLLGSTARREEGIELAKKGVRLDLTSFICWHALGILHRQDRNFEEAIKCYTQALRIEGGGNINLLRESAFLQLMLRKYAPMVENRLTLLRMQPHLRINWIGLAVAHHLAGAKEEAVKVLQGYENVMRDIPARNYEHSEVLLYHASILEEQAKYQEALDLMENQSERIVDLRGKQEAQARCFAGLGNKEDAEALWRGLIKSNPENKRYFAGLLNLLGITDKSSAQAVQVFKGLQEAHPKSTAAKRLALQHATGDEFNSQATAYVKSALVKGVPSLFSDLKSLYAEASKQTALEEIVETLRLEWSPTTTSPASDGTDPPTSYLWALYYLAQHYSLTGRSSTALHYIDSAIAQAPTLPELHMVRARILKRSGSLFSASHAMSDARLLDGQDRFLNSKSALYLIRSNDIVEAEKVVGLFTKPDAPSPTYDLNEMQALWYLIEEAEAFLRVGNVAMAMKRLIQVEKVFQEFWDDQLDFHSYCLRKMTLRSYVNMVRFEDDLRSHPVYLRAAAVAVKVYTQLYDDPNTPAFVETGEAEAEDPALAGLSESEKKKALKKARQAEAKRIAKLEAEAVEKKKKAEEAAANGETVDDDGPKPDPDPKGLDLFASIKDSPLKEATRWLRYLQTHAPQRAVTWECVYEISFREKNWLLATRALVQLFKLDKDHPKLVEMVIRLKSRLPDLGAAPKPIGSIITNGLAQVIPSDMPLSTYYTQALQSPKAVLPGHVLGNAKAALVLERKDEAISLLLSLPASVQGADMTGPRVKNIALKTAVEARSLLAQISPKSVADFDEKAKQVFPFASAFKTAEELEKEKIDREQARTKWAKIEAKPQQEDVQAGVENGEALHEPLM
ncbi:related to n-terminal acetyltransferase 1 [Melanopsichium pennsylvanicum]|uniref:Related to n-terminal acetyltransferase 1 n=2 Tax=Melanopsichium pennsylvanicum TaxID=63383 RepID=A0AAJ4XG86_9BASI|nr:related to n-terminal acetyltransferase 1 [Melanopsichium pennsylvanicum 4]SNX81905.1 related to n-terminal acetyltransferase 1 [Melanopsichium pennsylvanicum]